MSDFDFQVTARDHPLPDVILNSGISLERDGAEFRACCPFHGEKTPSFTVYNSPRKGWRFHCFGCGADGDTFDFVRELYGCTLPEAVEIVSGKTMREYKPIDRPTYSEASNPYEGYDIVPVPAGTPLLKAGERTPYILNPKRIDAATGKPKAVQYRPKMVFPYLDAAANLLGYVLRVEIQIGEKREKITPGVWWTRNQITGFEGWSHGSFPAPRPLYGLADMTTRPTDQVLIVEGEKCRDAAARVFAAGVPLVAASWMGGGKALSKVDWKPLKNRSVLIWPDNDEEGWKTVMGFPSKSGDWTKGIIEYAYGAGAERVKVIHITPESRSKGWDIADAEAEGLTAKDISNIIRERVQLWDLPRFEKWKARKIEAAQQQERSHEDTTGQEETRQHQGMESGQPEQPGESNAGMDTDRHGDKPPHAEDRGSGEEKTQPAIKRRGFEIDEETWKSHLIMKADGEGLRANSLQNAALMLQYERRFSGIFAWNDFAKEVYIMRRPPWDISGNLSYWTVRKIIDTDITAAACWLEYCGIAIKANDVGRIVQRVAQHNHYNPVLDKLKSLAWDNVSRVTSGDTRPGWLTHYFGAADTPENEAFGLKWLVGAVARAFQPGCKMDNMIILEGPQGLKKSSALRKLTEALGPGLFTDEISDPNSKDAALQMQGSFIVEIAELDAFRRAEITQIKAWLSRQTDRFRRPYGKIVEEFPRSCVFAGTVNPSGTGYLKDPTGARRFWPVKVTNIRLDLLEQDAEQIWAEAVAHYHAGQVWWLEGDENILAEQAQNLRYEEDPYAELINEFIINQTTVSTMQIMQYLDIPKERRNAIVNRRIASHLHARGWTKIETEFGFRYSNPVQLDLTDIPG